MLAKGSGHRTALKCRSMRNAAVRIEAHSGGTRPASPREQIAPLFERLETLEKVTEIGQVTRLLEVSELHKSAARKIVFAPRDAQEAPETTWVP
jgi:hypothetical protein